MTNNFTIDFSGVSESRSQKLAPGVYEFTISDFQFGESPQKKTPFARITFNAEQGTHSDDFYLTTNALPRLKHLLSKAGVSDDVLSGSVNTDQLVKACTGKRFRGRLNGREFVSSTDGKIRIAAEFGFANFAESISTTPSNLTFDPAKHIAKLKTDGMSTTGTTDSTGMPVMESSSTADDMPF